MTNKKSTILIALCYLIGLILMRQAMSHLTVGRQSEPTDEICTEEVCRNISVANTNASREKWLMKKKSLPQNQGMRFVFESEGIYPFWMKDTSIPLDILWVDSGLQITDSQSMVPCLSGSQCLTYTPSHTGQYVLEINAWQSEKLRCHDLKFIKV